MQKRSHNLRHYFLSDINPVIRFSIISDTVLLGAAGLLGPIFALFVEDFIVGGNTAVAGIAAGVYLFSRSILQIPIAPSFRISSAHYRSRTPISSWFFIATSDTAVYQDKNLIIAFGKIA